MFSVKKKVNDKIVIEELKIYADEALSEEKIKEYKESEIDATQCCNHFHLKGKGVSSMPFADSIPSVGSEQEKALDTQGYSAISFAQGPGPILFMKMQGRTGSDLRGDKGMFEVDSEMPPIKQCCDHEHMSGDFTLEAVPAPEKTSTHKNSKSRCS